MEPKPYNAVNRDGPDTAAVGTWWIEGVGIMPFKVGDRVLAKTIAMNLNIAYDKGKQDTMMKVVMAVKDVV